LLLSWACTSISLRADRKKRVKKGLVSFFTKAANQIKGIWGNQAAGFGQKQSFIQ
jgi:hypothetical protein